MHRRQFLLTTAATATAFAAQGPPPIRTALWGTAHSHTTGKLKAIVDSPRFELVGVCENDAAQRERAKNDPLYGGLRWLDETAMLADPTIQLIVVECSVWEALPMGRKVIDAGKHLHIEKPVGNDWNTFRKLVEDARTKKLLFQTGYVWRHHAGVMAAIEAAKSGWLGDILLVRASMNADRDAPQRAVEARYPGGGMFELGGHVIDRIVELLGRPKEVRSWLRHHSSVADTLADNSVAVFEYDRTLAVLSQTANQAGASDYRSFEIVGSDGTFAVWPEANPPRMRVFLRKAQGTYRSGWQNVTLPPQPRFVGDFEELGDAIQKGRPLKLSYEHELTLQETLLRASGEIA